MKRLRMKAKAKAEYDDRTTLWAVVPILVLCGLTSFLFWMSPLGLGFNDIASTKLQNGFVSSLYMFIFWAGPISIVASLVLIQIAIFKTDLKRLLRRLIACLSISVIISQISLLIYLTT
jgi:hypothetical protein